MLCYADVVVNPFSFGYGSLNSCATVPAMAEVHHESVQIRPATTRDLAQVAHLAGQLVRLHHSLDPTRFFLVERAEEGYEWFLGKELGRKESIIYVAERATDERANNDIVGYAWGRLEPRDWMELLDECGRLHEIFVDSSARRLGVGSRLVQETLRWLEAHGAPRIVLTSAWKNEQAHQFFESLGFRRTMVEMTRDRGS
jgi:ribosomal protein S18 acetylase RimI-like enzyme